MSVYFSAAREKWLYDFECGGKRYAGYCRDPKSGELARNKTQAKRMEAAIRASVMEELESEKRPGSRPTAYTVAQMLAEFAARKATGKNWVNEQVYVRELLEFFGADTPVVQVTEARVWEYVTWSRKQPLRVYMGAGKKKAQVALGPKAKAPLFKEGVRTRSDSTINRYLICLGAALRIAHNQRDGDGRPLLPELPKVPRLAEPEHLPRPISDENLAAIINHPETPAHVADAALLVRLMGFRKAEVFGLRIQQIDFSVRGVWLDADSTKGGRAECVPASDEALELLARLVGQARKWEVDHLFTYQHGEKGERRPVKNPRRAWNTVLKKLGIKHRWHDTKASFVTAVAQVASAATTKALARHKDHRTTERYIEVADPVRRQAVQAIAFGGKEKALGKSPKQKSQTAASSEVKTASPAANEKALEPLSSKASPVLPELVGATGFEPATPRPPV